MAARVAQQTTCTSERPPVHPPTCDVCCVPLFPHPTPLTTLSPPPVVCGSTYRRVTALKRVVGRRKDRTDLGLWSGTREKGCVCWGGGGGGWGVERERERDRQTDRGQRQTETNRQTYRGRQTDRDRQTQTETDRQTQRQTQTERQRQRQTQTERQRDTDTDTDTDRQTETEITDRSRYLQQEGDYVIPCNPRQTPLSDKARGTLHPPYVV